MFWVNLVAKNKYLKIKRRKLIFALQDVDINLSLSITNGMYMCMPLFSQDVTEGMPALVMSLQVTF